jgi:hypothetical protein
VSRACRREELDQRGSPLPAPNRQFMRRRAAFLSDPKTVAAMLVFFRMPDDHDFVHDRQQGSIL